MKLNYDCIRDVLLAIENLPYGVVRSIEQLNLIHYDINTVRYTVEKLVEGGFIEGNECGSFGNYDCLIRNLTIYGHQFLETIRPVEIWDKVKDATQAVGSSSLSVIGRVATQFATAAVMKAAGL